MNPDSDIILIFNKVVIWTTLLNFLCGFLGIVLLANAKSKERYVLVCKICMCQVILLLVSVGVIGAVGFLLR